MYIMCEYVRKPAVYRHGTRVSKTFEESEKMSCEDCNKLFEIKGKIVHLPDTDAVIDVRLVTQEPIEHYQFVDSIRQVYEELVKTFQAQ